MKELGEQQGFRALLEAPLPTGAGQIDVLLVRDTIRMPFEVSVTTPAAYERQSIENCLAAGFERVALVLAKSRTSQDGTGLRILEGLSEGARGRVAFLVPEELPDFIASLAPPPNPSESIVSGYKVRVSQTAVSPDEARDRRERLAGVIARSIARQKD